MNNLVIILLFAALAVQTAPVSLGMNTSKPGIIHLTIRIIFVIATHLLMLLLGIWLGNRFMYLLNQSSRIVLFAGFFLIGIRFIMDIFKIRKGERTYTIKRDIDIIVPSIALVINTFLSGILLYFVPVSRNNALLYLFLFSLFFTLLFTFQPFSRRTYAFNSLLYLLAGVILVGISFFFAFF